MEEAKQQITDMTVLVATYATGIDEFFRYMDVRMEYFTAQPVNTTVAVSLLSNPNFIVDIEIIAVLD